MQYNDLIYNSGPTNIRDYVSDKYNIIHNKLYEDALYEYVYGFSKDLIMKRLLYNLFICMNNCITQYNDEDEIINIEKLNELKNGQLYRIFTIDEIKETENLYNQNYIDQLKNYIASNKYNEPINNVFKSLSFNNTEQNDYILYIIVNIISLILDLKENIKNDIDYTLDVNNDFSDFIIRYKNTLYMIDEQELSLYTTEISDNEVFIYEDQYKMSYHIGFNKDGYFILDIDPEIDITDNYDKLYYIMSYINYLLLNMMLNDISHKFIDGNTIIEKPQNEYYLPSSIIIYQKTYPHKKTIVDLSPYWSNYQDHSDIDIKDIKYTDESIKDAQVEDINYVNGTVKIYSKINDREYIINKRYVNENTNVNDELINRTFIQNIS